MVRLEKILWEKVVNSAALGRQRVIGAPRKWFDANRNEDMKVATYYWFGTGVFASLFRLVEPVASWLFWKWPREIALNRGLAMEDFFLHQDRELRREVLFENIQRQACHPYQHLLFKRRRARFYKVERALRGFVVPDYLRKEAESRLLCDTADVKDEWENFMYKNYYSDMTPSTRYTAMHRLIPLEVFNVYGLFREEAWDRYFYNEVIYDSYSEQDYKKLENPFPQFNLDTDEGKRDFEGYVNRFINLYPGTLVKEGEQFNFKEFYARLALYNGKDTSRLDTKFVEEIKNKIALEDKGVSSLNVTEKKVGKCVLGSDYPARLQSKHRKVLM